MDYGWEKKEKKKRNEKLSKNPEHTPYSKWETQ